MLLDNKLSLKGLIAAHLEPLTHSSSAILSTEQEGKKTHGSIPFNCSITQMETVITWKLCTSLRGIECDLLSDRGESELIGSRCWCVQVIYCIHGHVDVFFSPHTLSRIIQLHVTTRPDGYISTQIKQHLVLVWCIVIRPSVVPGFYKSQQRFRFGTHSFALHSILCSSVLVLHQLAFLWLLRDWILCYSFS